MRTSRISFFIFALFFASFGYGDEPKIDGRFSEWTEKDLVSRDTKGDATGAFDITQVFAKTNGNRLYVHFDIGREINLQNGDESDGTLGLILELSNRRRLLLDFRKRSALLNNQPLNWSQLGFSCLPTYASKHYELRLDLSKLDIRAGEKIQLDFTGSDTLSEPIKLELREEKIRHLEIFLDRPNKNGFRITNLNTLNQGLDSKDRADSIRRLLTATDADIYCFEEEWEEEKFRSAAPNVVPSKQSNKLNLHWAAGCGIASTLSLEPLPMIIDRGAAALVELPSKDHVVVISLHLTCCGYTGNQRDKTRVQQARLLVDQVRKLRAGEFGEKAKDAGIIVIGDFNLVGSRKPLDLLKSSGLIDELIRSPTDGAAYTWRGLTKEESFWPGRLDLMVYDHAALKVSKNFILDTSRLTPRLLKRHGLRAQDSLVSDHLVLVADFEKSSSTAQATSMDEARVVESLKAAIRHEVVQKQLPAFSISLVDKNRVVWSDGFGFQDAENMVPATAETVYRVGSISKLFTDIVVMQLVEKGELDLDAPVQKYLPEFSPKNTFGIPITLRQMMSHRSGLVRESPVGSYFDPEEPTLSETVGSLNDTSLVYKPESKTKYSNAAIAVVGAILEKQLKVTHPEQVREKILNPLKMNHSSFFVTPVIEPNLATGWMRTYDGRRFEAPIFLLGTGPAGNMYSSVLDLSKFLVCLFNRGETANSRILDPESLIEMLTPLKDNEGKQLGFGLGFHVQDFDGYKKIGHGGAVYGFSTQLEALPERQLGVAAVSSLDGSNSVVRRLADYALRLMLAHQDGKPLPSYRMTEAIPMARAAELIGKYREVDGERFTRITELNGEVFMQRGSFRYELRAATDDGTIITDDSTGFGTKVSLLDTERLKVGDTIFVRTSDTPPKEIPQRWKGLIGEYGWDHNTLYILEDDARLYALIEWFYYYPLKEVGENEFEFPDYGLYHGEGLSFTRNSEGTATSVIAAEVNFLRREVGTKDGETFKITPVKPIVELRATGLSASPPLETGTYRDVDLVELTTQDPSIKLDIRYASTNNFTGSVFYKQPKAFMQRPAAMAVARANRRLKEFGLGLLVHDAYRPWHVTKMFWDATPADLKDFVANPANGSRHNRGCAVDLTLYDLHSGKPIQMVAGYDEFSPRSFPMYPGGTSRQRWYRDLLRRTMEAEGFSVYEFEWWHFDYKDWKKYRIGNATFEEISG